MKLVILKTNISNQQRVAIAARMFNNLPSVSAWSVDVEDVDYVLRIEAADSASEEELMKACGTHGINCETLPD